MVHIYIYADILSNILSGIYFDIVSDMLSGILSGIYSDFLSGIYPGRAHWDLALAVEGVVRGCQKEGQEGEGGEEERIEWHNKMPA
jgi:hypothetical protein